MPIHLGKEFGITSPQIFCSCRNIIYEMDMMNCRGCGDVICEDCYTDCFDCGKQYCKNCSESSTQCIKCNVNSTLSVANEKAFLVIDKVITPIKNSYFMIVKTAIPNARDIRLKLNGKTYKYVYRSLEKHKDSKNKFDYFLHFEEDINEEQLAKKIRDSLNEWQGDFMSEYDDYGTWGL